MDQQAMYQILYVAWAYVSNDHSLAKVDYDQIYFLTQTYIVEQLLPSLKHFINISKF